MLLASTALLSFAQGSLFRAPQGGPWPFVSNPSGPFLFAFVNENQTWLRSAMLALNHHPPTIPFFTAIGSLLGRSCNGQGPLFIQVLVIFRSSTNQALAQP